MVLLFHVGIETDTVQDPVADWFIRHGLLGVDIFFPLSGFLITNFLLKRYTKSDVGVFFLRRFFRIVPLYMAALAIYALASLATRTNLELLHNIWKNALFLTGWFIFHGEREMVPYTITWSLSVEEFAYIIIGLGALLLRGRIAVLLLVLTIGAIGLRCAINVAGLSNVYFYPPARLDSVALGGLTAWAAVTKKPVIVPLLIIFGLAEFVMQFGRIPFHTLIYVEISLLTCLLIHVIVYWLPDFHNPVLNRIASIGYYSYFIYLFHYFNIVALNRIETYFSVKMGFWIIGLIVLIVTYCQAWLSFRFYEGPVMAFGRALECRLVSGRKLSTAAEASDQTA